MARTPAIRDWLKQARADRVMTHESVADLFGVDVDDVKAWEAGKPVPESLLFSLTRWLETGNLPEGNEPLQPGGGYPWVTDPRA